MKMAALALVPKQAMAVTKQNLAGHAVPDFGLVRRGVEGRLKAF
jgi:hypothetical protein